MAHNRRKDVTMGIDLIPLEDEPWMEQANCKGVDPATFFPEKGGSTAYGKAICYRCTVQDECLNYAMKNDIKHGVWGNTSELERRGFRRKWKQQNLTA